MELGSDGQILMGSGRSAEGWYRHKRKRVGRPQCPVLSAGRSGVGGTVSRKDQELSCGAGAL